MAHRRWLKMCIVDHCNGCVRFAYSVANQLRMRLFRSRTRRRLAAVSKAYHSDVGSSRLAAGAALKPCQSSSLSGFLDGRDYLY